MAMSLLEEYLRKTKAVFGEDAPDTLTASYDLANLYLKQGWYAKAEPLFEACHRRRMKVLGKDHADTKNAAKALITIYYKQRRWDKASSMADH